MRITAAVAVLCVSLPGRGQETAPSTSLINHDAIVYSHRNHSIYVVDRAHSAILVLDGTGREPKAVPTGTQPVSIAVNERTGRVYVANAGSRSVTVVDGATNAVLATVPTAARPYAIALDAARNRVYVSNTFSNMLTVIDGATDAVTNVKTGSADAIAVDEQRGKLYLLGYESDALTVFDEDSQALSKLPAGALHLWGMLQSGRTLYVGHVQDASVAAIDLESDDVRTAATASMPCALAADPAKAALYVVNYAAASLTAISMRDQATRWTVPLGGHPQAIALDTVRQLVYVADAQAHLVSVVDPSSKRVAKKITTRGAPYALAVDPVTHRIFAATSGQEAYEEIRSR